MKRLKTRIFKKAGGRERLAVVIGSLVNCAVASLTLQGKGSDMGRLIRETM